MADSVSMPDRQVTWQIALFSGYLASAGLPLYIHLPRFAATLGLSLSGVAVVLIAIRFLDVIQDPVLGFLVDRFSRHRARIAQSAVAVMALGFLGLFTLQPGLTGFVVTLILLFFAYSLATIQFYAQGVALAAAWSNHYRVAGFRETGGLAGVLAVSILPGLLILLLGDSAGYAAFGLCLALTAIIVLFKTPSLWNASPVKSAPFSLRAYLKAGGGRLLLLGLTNAMPVAISSSLFLFFVEDVLALPDLAGPFLMLFFLAAGASAPIWSRLATRHGPVPVLIPAMALSALSFALAATLPEATALRFAVICIVSGAGLGADMVILPALYATRLADAGLPAGAGFGLWQFTGKLALALATVLALPLLDRAGFVPGGTNLPKALATLAFFYAIVPSILKLLAIIQVASLPREAVTT